MSFALLTLLFAASQDVPGLVVLEPRPPTRTRLIYEAACGSLQIRIEGYGHSRPNGTSPQILINGRRAAGEKATALKRDLADPTAVYRLSTRCTQPNGHLQLEVHTGRKVAGRMEYRVSGATFARGQLVFHGPSEISNEETFWFR